MRGDTLHKFLSSTPYSLSLFYPLLLYSLFYLCSRSHTLITEKLTLWLLHLHVCLHVSTCFRVCVFRNLVQRKAVWMPCCFIYIYNALLLSNPAWNSFLGRYVVSSRWFVSLWHCYFYCYHYWYLYLYSSHDIHIHIYTHIDINIYIYSYHTFLHSLILAFIPILIFTFTLPYCVVVGLDFSNFDLGLLTLAGAILSYFALVLYKNYLFETSWRKVRTLSPSSTSTCIVFFRLISLRDYWVLFLVAQLNFWTIPNPTLAITPNLTFHHLTLTHESLLSPS